LGFRRLSPIEHDLGSCYAELRAMPNRRALERSALWRRIHADVDRITSAVEQGDHETDRALGSSLRLVAWNVQRGARFDALAGALRGDPVLSRADVVLLTEIDCGLGRSANRNVARELADALGMSYVFGPSYLTLEDDWGENQAGAANTLALAGTAILSRGPIVYAENVDLPELRDKFSSSERRLGKKRALLVDVEHAGGRLRVGACHLDSNASPGQRARQLRALLDRIDAAPPGVPASPAPPAIIGGDFNSSTHDLSTPLAMVRDLLAKILLRGLRRSIDGYMRPDTLDEKPIFELLAARGFHADGFNDRTRGSYRFDFNDPYACQKLRRIGGPGLVWLVRRVLRRWNACVPARLDWFAARGLRAQGASVVDPRDAAGQAVSDHAAVVCDAALP
jgi:endonuclease/exonuclease/phosphatase family metal-dependent hydrolase